MSVLRVAAAGRNVSAVVAPRDKLVIIVTTELYDVSSISGPPPVITTPAALWGSLVDGLKTVKAAKALELELTYVNASITYLSVRAFAWLCHQLLLEGSRCFVCRD